ncbi:hypothetical protein ACFE04_031099 [Oxalis oulophora]
MEALGFGGFWSWNPLQNQNNSKRRRFDSKSSSSDSPVTGSEAGIRFPLKQAVTAGSLALTGDTIAQFRDRWIKSKSLSNINDDNNRDIIIVAMIGCGGNGMSQLLATDTKVYFQDIMSVLTSNHDWVRAIRMATYGFLLYGPGSYAWYQCLDHFLPEKTMGNLVLKVVLNQIVLGPAVIAVIFAWNNLWLGKLEELPRKYKKDALPTLLTGFKFWIPVSVLNFGVVPLQARVAFMSMGSIFWNFYLSLTMNK